MRFRPAVKHPVRSLFRQGLVGSHVDDGPVAAIDDARNTADVAAKVLHGLASL
jgi:hypothetical protein